MLSLRRRASLGNSHGLVDSADSPIEVPVSGQSGNIIEVIYVGNGAKSCIAIGLGHAIKCVRLCPLMAQSRSATGVSLLPLSGA